MEKPHSACVINTAVSGSRDFAFPILCCGFVEIQQQHQGEICRRDVPGPVLSVVLEGLACAFLVGQFGTAEDFPCVLLSFL